MLIMLTKVACSGERVKSVTALNLSLPNISFTRDRSQHAIPKHCDIKREGKKNIGNLAHISEGVKLPTLDIWNP